MGSGVDDRLDDLLAEVRSRGGRVTEARRAVLAILLATDGEHLSAEAIVARVQAHDPDVHLSTVYRSLEAFEEFGLISHVHLGHAPSTYHLTGRVHHHAVCTVCGRVEELPHDLLDGAARRLRNELGFTLHPHHFALEGRCAACATQPEGEER